MCRCEADKQPEELIDSIDTIFCKIKDCLLTTHCGTFKLDSGHKLQYACTFFLAFLMPKSNPPNDS